MKRMRTVARAAAVGMLLGALLGGVIGAQAATAQPMRGEDAAQKASATSSAVTLTNARNALEPEGAPFPELAVTVSQTKNLVSQGIRVSWTGGTRSAEPQGSVGGSNFLQIAQCWGEDPDNPGHPDRRTCQYGGTLGYGAKRDGTTRQDDVAPEDDVYTAPDFRSSVYTAIPFVAVNKNGTVDETEAPKDRVVSALEWSGDGWVKKSGDQAVDVNTNPFFTQYTTNEVKWAPTAADGTGSVPFEVQTAMQSEALGCGNPVQRGGKITGQSCWLVIIPRGEGDSGSSQIDRSGLWWDAWEHHLAVKLDFSPLGVRCEMGAAEQQLAGSELLVNAIASWQPQLCTGKHGAAFVHRVGAESDALEDASGTEPSPLALASLPLDTEQAGVDEDPLEYAPVALSATAITFAIDSFPHPQTSSETARARRGLPMPELKLTPRLVAKLLTSSYVDSLPDGADKSHIGYNSYADPGKNPRTLLQDPEFLEINAAEWAEQSIVGASIADALIPDGRSDQAIQLWNYVLSDPAAVKWLGGTADEWGMVVNPYYATNAAKNPTGAALSLPRDNFPKADPVEKPDTTQADPANGTGALNLVTWRPYTHSFADGAYHVLRGDGMKPGEWDKYSTPPKWGKPDRQPFSRQHVIALTTAPAAEQYQTVTASLLNPAGKYVKPTRTSIAAAAAAMTATEEQQKVRSFDLSSKEAKQAAGAYPLSAPVYAALNPEQSDKQLRQVYASMIRFAVKKGQTPGTDLGRLPPGYAPLPKAWVKEALAAARAIANGGAEKQSAKKQADAATEDTAAEGLSDTADTSDSTAEDTDTATVALAGSPTPADPPSPLAIVVPAGLALGALAAAATPLIGRFRRGA